MSVIKMDKAKRFPSVLNVMRGSELRRYVPERTCRDIGGRGETPAFKCSECGCELDLEGAGFEPTMWVGASAAIPRFCPNCGARAVEP